MNPNKVFNIIEHLEKSKIELSSANILKRLSLRNNTKNRAALYNIMNRYDYMRVDKGPVSSKTDLWISRKTTEKKTSTVTEHYTGHTKKNTVFSDYKDLMEYLSSPDGIKAWKIIRFKALAQFKGKCVCCGRNPNDHNVILHVDHIKPKFKYPELAFELSNLQVLCEDCNMGKGCSDETDFLSLSNTTRQTLKDDTIIEEDKKSKFKRLIGSDSELTQENTTEAYFDEEFKKLFCEGID